MLISIVRIRGNMLSTRPGIDPEGGGHDWTELRPAGARRLRRFRIPRLLSEACLINLPVLKTHAVSTMTPGI